MSTLQGGDMTLPQSSFILFTLTLESDPSLGTSRSANPTTTSSDNSMSTNSDVSIASSSTSVITAIELDTKRSNKIPLEDGLGEQSS